ncbi:MAG: GNAT family N-acetyltransferase [Deltaproteobacteria bacterium]|nr:GNAT family N-acetyltransferase [Deltaproteobacteria bacterium]
MSDDVKEVAIRDLSAKELEQTGAFLSRIFGARSDQEELLSMWKEDESRVVVVLVLAEEIVGVGVARCAAFAEEQSPYIRFPFRTPHAQDFEKGLRDEEKVGALQVLAIAEDKRHFGLGRRLATHLVRALLKRGVRFLVGVCWDNATTQTSKPLFIAAGFQQITSSVTFFSEEQKKSGQPCPHCSPDDCACNALLFVRKVDEAFIGLLHRTPETLHE